MCFTAAYLDEVAALLARLDHGALESMAGHLAALQRRGGRLFLLGVGGGAAHAARAAADFRRILHLEAYCPTDNVAELTARTDEQGWAAVFVDWLKVSRLCEDDLVFVLSLGGGHLRRNRCANVVQALKYARRLGVPIVGVVGREGGYTAQVADACVVIPTTHSVRAAAQAETIQGVLLSLLVSHPAVHAAAPLPPIIPFRRAA